MTDTSDAIRRQRAYYARTASAYDGAHLHEDGAHEISLGLIASLAQGLGARRMLDVGSGTGRGVQRLQGLAPGIEIVGVEPVPELVAQGHAKGIAADTLLVGDGASLPFADGSFDVVLATGVMHHVPEPRVVLAEMMRVARLAVFVSDGNRFGQGRLVTRVAKLGLWSAGLWKTFDKLRTRGKGYMESEGDGVFYSYSVFDDLPLLAAWGERTLVVPLDPAPTLRATWLSRFGPLLTSSHVLVGAFR